MGLQNQPQSEEKNILWPSVIHPKVTHTHKEQREAITTIKKILSESKEGYLICKNPTGKLFTVFYLDEKKETKPAIVGYSREANKWQILLPDEKDSQQEDNMIDVSLADFPLYQQSFLRDFISQD